MLRALAAALLVAAACLLAPPASAEDFAEAGADWAEASALLGPAGALWRPTGTVGLGQRGAVGVAASELAFSAHPPFAPETGSNDHRARPFAPEVVI